MIVYVLRHKQSGKLMPESKYKAGYSHWLRNDGEQFDGATKVPRLIESIKKANKIRSEWAKGVCDTRWEMPDDIYLQAVKVQEWKKMDRSIDDLEIIEFNLEGFEV